MEIDSQSYFRGMLENPNDFDKLVFCKTVNDLLDNSVKCFEEIDCISWLNNTKRYIDLKNDSLVLAAQLKDAGIKKGDVVGLYFKNEYHFVVSFFACCRIGAVCALLPSSLSNEQILGLATVFKYRLFLHNQDSCNSIVNSNLKNINLNVVDFNKATAVENCVIDSDDPACIVFTGGTTGNPKGALLSHRNLCRGALNGAYNKGKAFGHKYLSLIPFTHIFGLIKNLLSSILSGSSLYVCPNPTTFVKECASFNPDTMVLTPGLASMVLSFVKLYGKNLFGSNFSTIIAGGANVPKALINEFATYSINCYPGYGLTEAANLVSGNVSIDICPDSVGIAYPGQELKIVDNELWIKGDNVFLGYYGNETATAKILQNGWLHTGDLAKIDNNGFLYILGRKNNMIVLENGLKILPEEIEAEISHCNLVKDSVVRKCKANNMLEVEILLFENSLDNQNTVKNFIFTTVNKAINGDSKIVEVIFRDNDFKRTPAMKIIR